jgi:hypothetical protein
MPKKAKGTLNSKNPNPFELAYKELWDKLAGWRRDAILEDMQAGRENSRLQLEFAKEVAERAEEMYSVLEGKN